MLHVNYEGTVAADEHDDKDFFVLEVVERVGFVIDDVSEEESWGDSAQGEHSRRSDGHRSSVRRG